MADEAMPPATPLPAAAAAPAARMLGLQTPATASSSAIKSRKAPVKAPERSGSVWKTVRIIREHPTTPNVECLNCSKIFCAGATRIKDHILNSCTCGCALAAAHSRFAPSHCTLALRARGGAPRRSSRHSRCALVSALRASPVNTVFSPLRGLLCEFMNSYSPSRLHSVSDCSGAAS